MLQTKKITTKAISKHDLVYTLSIDTYINPGRPVKTLAVAGERRDSFFKQHHHVHHLLQHESTNPILEEGQQTAHTRSRLGEYYLTYDALQILIACHLNKKPKTYNTDNIFVIKNEPSRLAFVLQHINFAINDAKFIYIDNIHAIAGYVGQYQQQVYCFIVDSEGSGNKLPNIIIDAVQHAIPTVQVIVSTTVLQKDYFSCSTMAYQCLRYFCQHGADIAPYLQTIINEQYQAYSQSSYVCQMMTFLWHQGHSLLWYFISLINLYLAPRPIIKLPAHQLMPALLKLCQSKITLPEDVLATKVSHKQQLTLQDYLQQHQVLTLHGHALNSSAIEKRYRYFTKIDDYLVCQGKTAFLHR